MTTSTWKCAVLILTLVLAGPLAPMAALAQTYQTSATATPPPGANEPTDGHRAGAVFVNMAYVPGKVIVCTAGTLTSAAVLLLTFGSGYRTAVRAFEEGCGGDWVITPEHLSGKIPPRPES